MPSYVQKAKPRSRSAGRAYGVKRRRTVADTAALALREVRRLSKGIEVKTADATLFSDASAWALSGLCVQLNPVAVGTGVTQRLGEQIRAKRLTVRCNMNIAAASNFTYRFIVIRDKRSDGAVPSVPAIMTSGRTTAQFIDDVVDRFEVLHDRTIDNNVSFNLQDFRSTHVIDIPMDMTMGYDGANATDFNQNPVFMIVLGELGSTTQYTALAGGEAFVGFYSRLQYTDA